METGIEKTIKIREIDISEPISLDRISEIIGQFLENYNSRGYTLYEKIDSQNLFSLTKIPMGMPCAIQLEVDNTKFIKKMVFSCIENRIVKQLRWRFNNFIMETQWVDLSEEEKMGFKLVKKEQAI